MNFSTLLEHPAGRAWRLFQAISMIPRPSGEEARVRTYLRDWADARGWKSSVDAAGNLVIRVPGRGSLEKAPILVLQGHLDMVCEKNAGVSHNFLLDPIDLRVEDGWVRANGTTLGADNGVAIALACAAADAGLADCCPLELLFTVDEEVGLTGAQRLDGSLVQGRIVLNLDSEEDGVFTIGCAGGRDLQLEVPLEPCAPSGGWHVGVRGLRGGHSGVNIHENRGNAIQLLGQWLDGISCRVHGFHGGNKKNAIPREAHAFVSGCSEEALEQAREVVLGTVADEPNCELYVHQVSMPEVVASIDLVGLIRQLPQGVLGMDAEWPELVRTSNSLGVATTEGTKVRLLMHGRSPDLSERQALQGRIETLAETFGAVFHSDGDYPGWAPNPAGKLLQIAQASYERCLGEPPVVKGIHAGLETGIIGERLGTQELLSAGPQIENAHSPDEQLQVASFERTYAFLEALISSSDWVK